MYNKSYHLLNPAPSRWFAPTSTREDQDFSACSTTEPHLITQAELNDLVRDLERLKNQGWATWIKWNFLQKGVKVSLWKKRQANVDGDFVCRNDVCGLMEEL
jgi:hypothetical protein